MIEILNKQLRHRVDINKFRDLLKRLAEHYKLEGPEITLAFVNNSTIKDLNHRFMKKDSATDVLSFPLGEKGADGKFYLGDIIISVPQAYQQCLSKKHSLKKELELLTIHGFLHLLGIEHQKGMEEEEEKIRSLLLESKDGS